MSLTADRVAIIIPARYGSTRFPGKPLAPLRGASGGAKPMIERTWEAARAVSSVASVHVTSDDARVLAAAAGFGAATVATSDRCRNGSERCAETVAGIDADIIVNLQGDAPLTPPDAIEALIGTLREDHGIAVASAMIACPPDTLDRLLASDRAGQAGGTTVVCDRAGHALYFSKRVIPFLPALRHGVPVFLHLGVYAYRRAALLAYAAAAPSVLEEAEGLEQLRFLDQGIRIRMVEVQEPPGGLWEVNHPSDIRTVEAALAARGLT